MNLSLFSKVKQEQRSTLFYNRFRYRAKFTLFGADRTYYTKTVSEFEARISLADLDKVDLSKIEKLIDLNEKYYYKRSKLTGALVTLDRNTIKVYTNDESVIDDYAVCNFDNSELTEAALSVAKDVKLFTNRPPHNFRVYFKDRRVDVEFKESLKQFLKSQPWVYPSQSLERWLYPITPLRWREYHLQQSHSIDFDDESTYTLLLLYFGGQMIRKYYRLEQR